MKKNRLLPLVLSAVFLSSCAFSLGGSTSSNKAASVTSSKPITSSIISAESTSFMQSDVALAGADPVLPSVGTQKILVIPVMVDDYKMNATEANLARIQKNFFGEAKDTSWESLASYYEKSSYGKLKLTGTVTSWYDCGYTTTQINNLKGTSTNFDPTWAVLDGAVEWCKKTYNSDGQEFDQNHDGYLDGVWLVNSAPDSGKVRSLGDNFWAFTYSNYEKNASKTSPNAWRYCWASYDFMDGYGTSGIDAHTYIHETGHLMGLDDYYVSKTISGTKNYGPMGGIDMMDDNIIDHNAYSKFALGWIDPFVVRGSTTVTLSPSSTSGQAILLPTSDGWNGSAFDEYMLLEYYTPTNLNEKDSAHYYPENEIQGFTENGVRIYHVDARLALVTATTSGNSFSYTDYLVDPTASSATYLAHSNSNYYNNLDQNFRLIQEMDCTEKRNFDTEAFVYQSRSYGITADNDTLFQNGDSFDLETYKNSFPNYYYNKAAIMNDGSSFSYKISFGAMTEEGASLTITKA